MQARKKMKTISEKQEKAEKKAENSSGSFHF